MQVQVQIPHSGIWFAVVSHLIQSNAFESNASANANADESNANASANTAFAFANASAFEHKPGT